MASALSCRVAAVAVRSHVRCMSSAAVNVDWALLRSKMMTEEAKQEVDKTRDVFNRRIAAANAGAGASTEIDWAAYKSKLPDLDVDALRADYEAFVKAIPATTYDETADRSAHATKEAAWAGFAKFCTARAAELETLAAEQQKHKLHRWYRRSFLYQRFPGLYEALHHRVRGTWDHALWAQYLAYKSRSVAVPWDVTHGDVDAVKRQEMLDEIASRSGLSKDQMAVVDK